MTIICGTGAQGGPVLSPEDLDDARLPCCYGSAEYGPSRCTCWEPIYDLEQSTPQPAEISTRLKMCDDCAYRRGSPERVDGRLDGLQGRFFCHQGMRRPRNWRHPDGRIRPGSDGDYQPPIVDAIPYRADGTPAMLCAGWAATHG